jgi:hypothetical protein
VIMQLFITNSDNFSLLDLVVDTKHDCYVKLVVSSLEYSTDGVTRWVDKY